MNEQGHEHQKPNPYNSPTLQAFLDVIRAMEQANEDYTDINVIVEELKDPQSTIRPIADRIWEGHKYPDKKLRFFQSLTYNGNTARNDLPRLESAVLTLMEQLQSRDGYVAVHKQDFVDVLHMTDGERKGLQAALDHLAELGYITTVYKPPKGSRKPGVYQLNRLISWVGERGKAGKVIRADKPKYKRVLAQVTVEGGKVVEAGILDCIDTANEPISGGTDTGSKNTHTSDISSILPFDEPEVKKNEQLPGQMSIINIDCEIR